MQTLLEQAVSFIKAGNKEDGKRLLIEILKRNPKDENAWLWMSKCVESVDQKKDCFQRVLQINPNNQFAIEGLRRLDNSLNKQGVQPAKLSPKKKSVLTTSSILVIICICIVFSTLGGVVLNLSNVPDPAPTSVPVVIDAISLMGKPLGEIRLMYSVVDPLYELSLSEPDREYANIDYGEEYTDGKYKFTIFYDEKFFVNQVDLTVLLYTSPDLKIIGPTYKMSEWRAVMQMLNLGITYPPDEANGIDDIPFSYVWRNYNGYRVWINRKLNENIILYSKVIRLK